MNKIFKCALFGMLFLLSIVGIKEVHAETYTGQAIWPSEYISNIYIKKVKPDVLITEGFFQWTPLVQLYGLHGMCQQRQTGYPTGVTSTPYVQTIA